MDLTPDDPSDKTNGSKTERKSPKTTKTRGGDLTSGPAASGKTDGPGKNARQHARGTPEATPGTPSHGRFMAHIIDVAPGHPQAYLNTADAEDLGLHPLDRVSLTVTGTDRRCIAILNTTTALVGEGKVGVTEEVAQRLELDHPKAEIEVDLFPAPRPRSVELIRKKMDGLTLSPEEIRTVIHDIAHGQLSDIELTAYAVAVYVHDLNLKEIVAMIDAMVEGGESITFDRGPILDIHSIGGVPGNKYAPLVVPIVAANGLIIPKTSSRAISSACGTADFMEVLCPVEHSAADIKRIAEDCGGTMAWGGGVRLAPADDAIIRVEYPLSMDPHGQLIASVLAKKKAVGAQIVVIEIPTGPGAKVETDDKARRLARDFIAVGEEVGLQIRVAITFGAQPIGYAIGPALEAREALAALEGTDRPGSLVEKACELGGLLLELAGKAQKGEGYDLARKTLESGAAHKTFLRLIELQGGNVEIRSEDIQAGEFSEVVTSPQTGYVESIANKALVKIARAAGAPRDKGAGLLLHAKLGHKVAKGDPLYTIYSEHQHKLGEALRLGAQFRPLKIEGMIIEEIVE